MSASQPMPDVTVKLESKALQPGAAAPPYLDSVSITEVYVDGLASVQMVNGQIKLTLYTEQQLPSEQKQVRPVVARLVMSPAAGNLIAQTLKSILDKLVADGAIGKLPVVVTE